MVWHMGTKEIVVILAQPTGSGLLLEQLEVVWAGKVVPLRLAPLKLCTPVLWTAHSICCLNQRGVIPLPNKNKQEEEPIQNSPFGVMQAELVFSVDFSFLVSDTWESV